MGAGPGEAGGPSRRLRLVLAYDGGPFSGFARQRDRRTVQGELETALSRIAKEPVETVPTSTTRRGSRSSCWRTLRSRRPPG